MPREIATLAGEMLHRPATINLERKSAPAVGITQAIYPVPRELKSALLLELVRRDVVSEAIVFTRTKHRTNRLAEFLEKNGIDAARIHGNRSQGQRTAALEGFKAGKHRLLVATDIVARGIDVEALSHVINFDVPADPDAYIHRVGRTRARGAEGRRVHVRGAGRGGGPRRDRACDRQAPAAGDAPRVRLREEAGGGSSRSPSASGSRPTGRRSGGDRRAGSSSARIRLRRSARGSGSRRGGVGGGRWRRPSPGNPRQARASGWPQALIVYVDGDACPVKGRGLPDRPSRTDLKVYVACHSSVRGPAKGRVEVVRVKAGLNAPTIGSRSGRGGGGRRRDHRTSRSPTAA
jgi:ATP-dependent RNA helicase RhlE